MRATCVSRWCSSASRAASSASRRSRSARRAVVSLVSRSRPRRCARAVPRRGAGDPAWRAARPRAPRAPPPGLDARVLLGAHARGRREPAPASEPFSCSRKAVSRSASARSRASAAPSSPSRGSPRPARAGRARSPASSAPGPAWRARGEVLALAVGVAELAELALDLLVALAREGLGRRQPRLELGEPLPLLAEGLQLLGELRLAELDLLLRGGDLRGTEIELGRARAVSLSIALVSSRTANDAASSMRRSRSRSSAAVSSARSASSSAVSCTVSGKGLLERRGLESDARRPPTPPPVEASRSPRGRRAPGASELPAQAGAEAGLGLDLAGSLDSRSGCSHVPGSVTRTAPTGS